MAKMQKEFVKHLRSRYAAMLLQKWSE